MGGPDRLTGQSPAPGSPALRQRCSLGCGLRRSAKQVRRPGVRHAAASVAASGLPSRNAASCSLLNLRHGADVWHKINATPADLVEHLNSKLNSPSKYLPRPNMNPTQEILNYSQNCANAHRDSSERRQHFLFDEELEFLEKHSNGEASAIVAACQAQLSLGLNYLYTI